MTYEWDVTAPVDATFSASSIHTQIQQDKVSLRERFECPNGDFNEHGDTDSADAGLHIASKVGWARLSTLADRYSTGLKVGSLHYTTDEEKIYTIDEDKEFVAITETDHTALTGLDDDDHTQYVLKDGTRAMSGNITLNGGTLRPEDYPEENDGALNPTHADESWHTAHGDDSIRARHLADESVNGNNLNLTVIKQNTTITPLSYCSMLLTRARGVTSVGSTLYYQPDGTVTVFTGTLLTKRVVAP